MAKKKKRRIRWGRVFFALFLVIFLICSLGATGAYFVMDYKLNHGKSTYIAVIGTDERPSDTKRQRSDVVMFASIDFEDSNVKLISLPRDSLVDIPCRTDLQDKITHAYAYGGKECTMDAMEVLFEVDEIEHYVQVNFDSLIALVDDLGGITLTPTKSFSEYNVDKSQIYTFEQGVTVEMDGAMALAYCRHRKSDSDIFRTQRQQEVLMAMLAKAKKLELFDVYKLGKKVLNEVDTNITIMDALTYFKLVLRDDFTLTKTSAKGSDCYIDGGYYYQLDENWLSSTIQSLK